MHQYISVRTIGNYILYRGVTDGKRVNERIQYSPSLFTIGQSNGPWKTLDGKPLHEHKFNTISESRRFLQKYEPLKEVTPVYGNARYQYAWICDNFPGTVEWKSDVVNVAALDIEVDSSAGFPDPDKASAEVTAITVHIHGKYHVFGKGEYNNSAPDVIYHQVLDEVELLAEFVRFWIDNQPDVITGWNVKLFDMPYLYNRISSVLGGHIALGLSPWQKVDLEEINWRGRSFNSYDIWGISTLDYQDLYKKYAPNGNQDSYTLDNIAEIELQQNKLDTSEWGSLPHEVAANNWQAFIDYNIQDVRLINQLDAKLKLIDLVFTLAYRTKTNYEDVFSQGRMWDTLIYDHLKTKKIAPPQPPEKHRRTKFEGAYVKEPIPGLYKWVVSFDLTSLYPHLMMMYNLSPEAIVDSKDWDAETRLWFSENQVNVNNILDKKLDLSWLKKKNLTMTPNGELFRMDRQGFLGEILEDMFHERTVHKKIELKAKSDHDQDLADRKHAIQWAIKIALNSCYGSVGNVFFRFFDLRLAEAVTLSGQLSIRWIQNALNEYLNNLSGENKDWVIASDTDSVYLNLETLVDKVLPGSDPQKIVKFLDKFCEKKLKPFIDNSYNQLTEYVNAKAGKMVMKRESICDSAIWCAKKNYALSVWNSEGVEYTEPEIKIVGWAAVRTTTPRVCRKRLKESVKYILHSNEPTLRKFVEEWRKEFDSLSLDKIACPSGLSDLDSYDAKDDGRIYKSGAPQHVRSALLFNYYIKKLKLDKRFEPIRSGDKVKYLKLRTPNPFNNESSIAFKDKPPGAFELEKWVDKDAQFYKVFLMPLDIMLNSAKWKLVEEDTLEDLFT